MRSSGEATGARIGAAAIVAALLAASALLWAAPAGAPPVSAAAPAAPAGPAPIAFGGPAGRFALAGTWIMRLDPAGRGARLGYQRGCFAGRSVRVPFSPNARHVTSLESYRGSIAWYRTSFDVATSGAYAIRFESVNHRARVWLDGRLVARHTGAYLPFEARPHAARGPARLDRARGFPLASSACAATAGSGAGSTSAASTAR